MSDTYKVECQRCFGTGIGGHDDRNGVFHSGRCYACGGRGSVEYTIKGGDKPAQSLVPGPATAKASPPIQGESHGPN